VLDAYCGVGPFALALSAKASQVIGVDGSAAALADARANAADTENALFVEGLVEETAPGLPEVTSPLVVVDPPRTGLDKEALAALLTLAPLRVVYVSCDPATMARDIGRFVSSGYYLYQVQPVDMFPQTYHIECVALLASSPNEAP